MELVAGCYEQVLLGFAARPGEPWTVDPDFTHHAHTASLSAVAVNSKYVVTGSRDETIQIYDMRKKVEHGALLQHNDAHIIKWSPDGEKYVTVITNKVDIYKLDTASITGTITTEKRISSLRFITDSVLAIAGDDEIIRFYSCDSQKCLCEFKAHENRIKDIYSFEREGRHVIVTASSDGYIKVWNLDLNQIKNLPSLLCEVNTKARLTCLAVWLDQASEMKENCEKAATSAQGNKIICIFSRSRDSNEDEKPPVVKRRKVCWTNRSGTLIKRRRRIVPAKRKLEAALRKKKKKQNSSE
ncbi:UNVERIFIED_CONTAM: hypothetical protein H355_008016 [Colinus virginianus]|nr:hypothetical protein H355_008016 [Colinus virginianus]